VSDDHERFALKPRCLAKSYAEGQIFGTTVFRALVEDNDEPGRMLTITSGVEYEDIAGLDADERIAFGMLLHYIHECGEHVLFRSGYTFNQHSAVGGRNVLKLLKRALEFCTKAEGQRR
jgi:hypothetical protein